MCSSSSSHLENPRFFDDVVELVLAGERDNDSQGSQAHGKRSRAAQVLDRVHYARPISYGQRRAFAGA